MPRRPKKTVIAAACPDAARGTGDERWLDPMMKDLPSMEPSMAGGAERDQKSRLMEAGPSVVDGQFPAGPTAAVAAAVASEDLLAVFRQNGAGNALAGIAAGTQAGGKEAGRAAEAEKPGLADSRGEDTPWGVDQARRALNRRIARWEKRYRVRIRLIRTSGVSPCGETTSSRNEASLEHLSHLGSKSGQDSSNQPRGHTRTFGPWRT